MCGIDTNLHYYSDIVITRYVKSVSFVFLNGVGCYRLINGIKMAPVLGYWDLRGLASPIRILLHYRGVEFEDKIYVIGPAPEYDRTEWSSIKPTLGVDFPNLPYYIDGDVKLTQSTTILRYLGRKYGLAGDNESEIQRIELAEQQADDLRRSLIRIVYFNPNYFSFSNSILMHFSCNLSVMSVPLPVSD